MHAKLRPRLGMPSGHADLRALVTPPREGGSIPAAPRSRVSPRPRDCILAESLANAPFAPMLMDSESAGMHFVILRLEAVCGQKRSS
jgi:hypothetical protein